VKKIAGFLCDLTAPRFLGPYGMDIAGTFPMTWDEDARWDRPSKLHLFLSRLAERPNVGQWQATGGRS
jgi:hypothetical protein